MVVVSLVAELISKLAIFQENTTNLISFDQEAEAAKNGGASHTRDRHAEVLGRKGPILGGNCADYEATGFGIPISQARKSFHDVVHNGG